MVTKSDLARLGLFDSRVPRYTSYPTAPHFTAEFAAETYADWLRRIPPGSSVSLYVHVPFCRRLCWFCACRTQGTKTLSPVASYVDTLKAELALLRDALPNGVTLSRLHWGGGTPTLLSSDMINELAAAIFDVAPLAENGEFSVRSEERRVRK